MKFALVMLSALSFASVALAAPANLPAIQENTQAMEVATVANSIHDVTFLRIGKIAYQIVQMDSGLNGDLSSTILIMVGEQAVGGNAGFEHAFQVGPNILINAESIKVRKGRLVLRGLDAAVGDYVKKKTISVKYLADKKELEIK